MATTTLDPAVYRRAIGLFVTGVTVITTRHEERRLAMTANSVTSVSTDPQLVLVSFMLDSETGAAVRETGRFALNVLPAEGGVELARRCARKLAPGEDQLEGLEVEDGPRGLPLLARAVERLVCEAQQLHVIGDHEVVVARAEAVPAPAGATEPLVFFRGGFWRLSD